CVFSKKPLVSGAILKFEGQLTTIIPGEGHCYRCLFEEMPPAGFAPSCRDLGVVGAIAGVVGSLQAIEVIKLILGKGEVLKNRLLIYDALNTTFRRITIPNNKECRVCGENPTITDLQDFETEYCTV